MENEALFAGEPEVDAQMRARERTEVTENTRLLSQSDEPSQGQPSWRNPSVSAMRIFVMKLQDSTT